MTISPVLSLHMECAESGYYNHHSEVVVYLIPNRWNALYSRYCLHILLTFMHRGLPTFHDKRLEEAVTLKKTKKTLGHNDIAAEIHELVNWSA